MFTHCWGLYQHGGWLVLILSYELHCQSFEQLSPIHRQLAWCAVWHGVQHSTVCSTARCAVWHGAAQHSVQHSTVCSVARCAVWHGVQCGMVFSVALRATALFTLQHPPLEWLLPHRNLAEEARMQERCLLWFILCRRLPSPRRVHFKRVVPVCSFCSEFLLFDLHKCNSCFRVPHWPVQKAIKADGVYSDWMTVPQASFCDVHHHILDHRLVWDISSVHSLTLLCKPLYTLWCCYANLCTLSDVLMQTSVHSLMLCKLHCPLWLQAS